MIAMWAAAQRSMIFLAAGAESIEEQACEQHEIRDMPIHRLIAIDDDW